jgi:hypothetical protein
VLIFIFAVNNKAVEFERIYMSDNNEKKDLEELEYEEASDNDIENSEDEIDEHVVENVVDAIRWCRGMARLC